MGIEGESSGLGIDCDREGERSLQNQHRELGRQSLYLKYPNINSNPNQQLCSSSEPGWHTLTRELSRVQICLISILKQRVLLAQEPRQVTVLPTVESISLPHLTGGVGRSTWELCSSAVLDSQR